MKIKKGDTIKMLSGKDAGKTGKILKSFPSEKKVLVEGLNLIKKHSRPRRQGEKGQRLELPRKIPISSVIFLCSKCSQATRVEYKKTGKEKVRICKKCRAEI